VNLGRDHGGLQELSEQLTSALHQQLTVKRAASGVYDPVGLMGRRGNHHHHQAIGTRHSSSMSGSGGSAGGGSVVMAGGGGEVLLPPVSRSSSSSGVKRAVMSLKSVKQMPLSMAAKSTIINTIADNALAAFVVIQVGGWGKRDVIAGQCPNYLSYQ
jgi:hypothetical protein